MTNEIIPISSIPTTTLDKLLQAGDSTAKPITILNGYNLGNNTLIASLPFDEFLQGSEVANERGISENRLYEGEAIAQRKLDVGHATKLAQYMLKGMINDLISRYHAVGETPSAELLDVRAAMGVQPYFALQPIVANLRSVERGGKNLRAEKIGATIQVYLSHRDVLWVVDGQHRRYAISLLIDYLQSIQTKHLFPKRPAIYPKAHDDELSPSELRAWTELHTFMRTDCTLAVEVHLGLDAREERQLFHDLNNLGKKVDANLAFEFDNANPVNVFIKENLASIVHLSNKDMIGVNALLFLNKTNVRGAQPADVVPKAALAERFWRIVSALPGFGQTGVNVLSQTVVLKALAKVTYDLAWGKNADWEELELFFGQLDKMNFEHGNPLWRYYTMDAKEHGKTKLGRAGAYLPAPPRDLGKYDETADFYTFGTHHNDIYPVIGDMIRWSLGLKKRPEAITQK